MILSVVLWTDFDSIWTKLASDYLITLNLPVEVQKCDNHLEIRGYVKIDALDEYDYWKTVNIWLENNHRKLVSFHKYGQNTEITSAFFRHRQKLDTSIFIKFARENVNSILIRLHNIDHKRELKKMGVWDRFIGVA